MYAGLTFFLVLVSFFVHEVFGHAAAMATEKVPVTEVSFGMPCGPAIRFPPKRGKIFAIYYLCPFGASVKYDEKYVESLTYVQTARIYGAGPFASLVFGLFLIVWAGASAVIENHLPWQHFFSDPIVQRSAATIAILLAGKYFGERLLGARRFFVYVAPFFFIGFPVAFAIWSHGELSGPIGLATAVAHNASDITNVFWLSGLISIGIGAAMSLPLYPLDGAGILRPLIKKYFPDKLARFQETGWMVLGLIFLLILQKELPIILSFFS
jgi:hypothetical protein